MLRFSKKYSQLNNVKQPTFYYFKIYESITKTNLFVKNFNPSYGRILKGQKTEKINKTIGNIKEINLYINNQGMITLKK